MKNLDNGEVIAKMVEVLKELPRDELMQVYGFTICQAAKQSAA